MNVRKLERLFGRILRAAPSAVLLACSSSTTPSPAPSQPDICASTPPGHTDATFAVIDAATLTDPRSDGGAPFTHFVGEHLYAVACEALCPPSGTTSGFCSIESIQGDVATLACHRDCTGRRPEGLDPTPLLGAFAEMARLEAASVLAFRRLRAELAHYGAPRRLRRACGSAARDEIRHAKITAALARRRGERVEEPRIEAQPTARRSLEAFALENAIEGCVRETWGAIVATREAESHPEPMVRAAMKRIARDETRHAALAWSIAAWLEPRLDRDARARVRNARAKEAFAIAAVR